MFLVLAVVTLACASREPTPARKPATVEVSEITPRTEPAEPANEEDVPPPARAQEQGAVAACKGEPTGDDLAEAKKQFAKGVELLSSGDDAQAAAAFARAYVLSCKPAVLYNLGVTLERLGDSAGAIAAYERYLEAEPDGQRATELRERIALLRSKSGR